MPLSPELQPLVDLVNAANVPPPLVTGADVLRRDFESFFHGFGVGPQSVATIEIGLSGPQGEIPARLYRPDSLEPGMAAPALVFFHGGGFVIGSLGTHDCLCRQLAVGADVVVVSVDYRRAPEEPFPAAIDDADAAVVAVVERAAELGIDPDRVAVGGDSAGGNLATVVARRWRDRAATSALPSLRFQLLVYPVCEQSDDTDRFPSRAANGEGYLLTTDTMQFFTDNYLPEAGDRTRPDASPLRAEDLSGLAPALVITAEFDPLCDEGEAYAARLAGAGVPTTVRRFDGAVHMFVQMAEVTEIGRRGLDAATAALREALQASSPDI